MRARTKLVVPAVVALLLAALTSVTAHAETSSEITYYGGGGTNRPVPHVEGPNNRIRPQRTTVPPTSGSEAPGEAEPEADEGKETETATSGRRSEPPPGNGDHPRSSTRPAIGENRPVSEISTPATLVADSSDAADDGSSPILPILIAVAVLAILSAGVAFFNERLRSRRRG